MIDMRHLNRKRLSLSIGTLFLLLLPALAGLINEPYLLSLFSRILIYALAAVGLDLMPGFGGMVSLGHAAFFGIGTYVVCILSVHAVEGTPLLTWPVVLNGQTSAAIAWPAAILLSAAAAAVIGALSLRTSGMHFIMITLAFSQMLYYFFISLEAYGGDDPINLFARNSLPGVDLSSDLAFYYTCLVLLALFLFFSHRMLQARFGMVIRGCRENEPRMRSLGFATFRYRLTCFIIAERGWAWPAPTRSPRFSIILPSGKISHWPFRPTMVIAFGSGARRRLTH